MEPKVMIILGSASDFKIAEKATAILEKLEIYYDLRVASAHRTHEKVKKNSYQCSEKWSASIYRDSRTISPSSWHNRRDYT